MILLSVLIGVLIIEKFVYYFGFVLKLCMLVKFVIGIFVLMKVEIYELFLGVEFCLNVVCWLLMRGRKNFY